MTDRNHSGAHSNNRPIGTGTGARPGTAGIHRNQHQFGPVGTSGVAQYLTAVGTKARSKA